MSFSAYLAGSAGLIVGVAAIFTIATVFRARLLGPQPGPVGWVATIVTASATAVVLALILGSFGILEGWTYLALVVGTAIAVWVWRERIPGAGPLPEPPRVASGAALTAVGLAVAALAVGVFSVGVRLKYGTGMTGFDSTWYHGPFAAGLAGSGDTFSLQFLAPQFLSWFYPQNSELIHSLGILGFGNDLLSPLINIGWLGACLLAAWCIGRPYGGAAISVAGVAIVLASTAMIDQAGEARNDIVGTFFVLAALALLVNFAAGGRKLTAGPVILIALSAGLAAGTKVNFIPAALALGVAAVVLAEPAIRRRAGILAVLAGLLAGGYWYLRNLIHSGNPLPWIDHVGPIGLPGPDQDVGGRGEGSVWGYLTETTVIGDWFLPGFEDGFGQGWPVLLLAAGAGLLLCLWRGSGPARRTGAAVGLALVVAWLVAPTSASGPPGEPAGFVSGLRYLAPAAAVGLALLGSAVGPRGLGARWLVIGVLVLLTPFTMAFSSTWGLRYWLGALLVAATVWFVTVGVMAVRGRVRDGQTRPGDQRTLPPGSWAGPGIRSPGGLLGLAAAAAVVFGFVLAGQVVQRSYFENRYADPDFTTAGLSKAFAWARRIEDRSIATNATRQYPLMGTMLSNRVGYIGVRRPAGGFVKPETCTAFKHAINRGGHDYAVVTLDRPSPNRAFARELAWIEGDPAAEQVFRVPPTAVFELTGPLDPGLCR